jgi:alkanesulfonate monooxygenase SsuD/methylene tetrahydromethanopterin reductase-like flavin-dependent oxidoreductase (luciferase family)
MTVQEELLARMNAAEGRLAIFAEDPPPGLTDPDPATGEQWDVGQAWAHVAEFVPYWQGEIEHVLAGAARGEDPVPFGRTSADPGRVGAIEAGRHEPPAEQMARLAGSLTALRAYLGTLSEEEWNARGTHARLGEMTVARIMERFIVGHLEEHAEQLEKLAQDGAAGGNA